jgi:hypothetical protein
MTHLQRTRSAIPSRFAPWWVYVGVVWIANALRQLVMPVGIVPEWAVVLIVLGMSGALVTAITVLYRVLVAARPGDDGRIGTR